MDAETINSNAVQEFYKGTGSKYYDLVTKEIACTAKHGAKTIKDKLENNQ